MTFFRGRDGTGQTGQTNKQTNKQTNRHTDRQTFLGKYCFRWGKYVLQSKFFEERDYQSPVKENWAPVLYVPSRPRKKVAKTENFAKQSCQIYFLLKQNNQSNW